MAPYDGRAVDKRRIQDTEGDTVDVSTHGLTPVIKAQKYQAFKGRRNYVEMIVTVPSLATRNMIIDLTGLGVDNMQIEYFVEADNIATVTLQEDITYTGGSALTPRNINRNESAITNGVTFKQNATITAPGTTLQTLYINNLIERTDSDRRNTNWVLQEKVIYAIQVANGYAGNLKVIIALTYNMSQS